MDKLLAILCPLNKIKIKNDIIIYTQAVKLKTGEQCQKVIYVFNLWTVPRENTATWVSHLRFLSTDSKVRTS